jgi:uncharacterized delta-60 repeat protein
MKRYAVAVILLFAFTSLYSQSLSPVWVNRYSGTGDNSDVYNKIIPDGSGNFIAVGYTVRSGNYKDFLAVKLNSSLDTVWTRTHNGKGGGDDEAISAVVDGSGNIYVCGYIDNGNTGDDFYLIKYDGSGNTIWDTAYYSTTAAFMDDHPAVMALSPSGDVILAGWSQQGTWVANANDMLIVSFNSSGGVVFAKKYGRFNAQRDDATAMVIDGSGNIYVTGRSSNGIDDDWVTMKLNSAGTDLWSPVKVYDGGNGNDRPVAMGLTSAGNVVITGRSRGTNDDDYRTIWYSSAGAVVYNRAWAGAAGHDRPTVLAIDASDNVYVTGESDRDASTNTNYDFSTVKYNATAVQQWQRYWAGAAGHDDVPAAIATDSTGNVFIAGLTENGAAPGVNDDWAVISYDGAGNSPWQKIVDGSRGNNDEAYSVVTDGSGNVYVAGSINNTTTQSDASVIKYDGAGNLSVTKSYNGEGDFNDDGIAMAQDASGNTYTAGYTYNELNNKDILITKVDAAGSTVVSKTFQGIKGDDDELTALVYDANGYLYACGYTKVSGEKSDYITIKYTLNLDTVWTRTYNYTTNQSDKAESIAVDGSGNVYVTGRSDANANDTIDNRDIVTIKYNSIGTQQWLQRYNGSSNLNDEPVKMMLNNGNVFIAGTSANATDGDIVVLGYTQSTGGAVSGFPVVFNSGSGKNDNVNGIAADASGNIYVAGYSDQTLPDQDYVLVKYSNTGGAPVWTRYYSGTGGQPDHAAALCIDSQGSVIVTGKTDVDINPLATNYDYLTTKYDASGNSLWSALPDYNGNAGEDDEPADVATDASDNIYVTGQSQEGTVTIKNKDIMTRIYLPDGTLAAYADYDGGVGSDGGNDILQTGHSFFVAGYSEGALNAQKDMVTLKYDESVGVNEISSSGNASLFPNPFSTSAKIILNGNISASLNLTLKIFDALGKEVQSRDGVHAPVILLNREHLAAGIYQFRLLEGNVPVAMGKFAVN